MINVLGSVGLLYTKKRRETQYGAHILPTKNISFFASGKLANDTVISFVPALAVLLIASRSYFNTTINMKNLEI